eukprot:111269_1
MCWSAEVSLVFFTLGCAGLLYIFCRNQYIDRYWCLIVLPIVIVEFCQFILWKFGIDSHTTSTHCNTINKRFHAIVLMTVNLIPLFIAITSYHTTSTVYENYKWIKNVFWKYLVWMEIIIYCMYIYVNIIGSPALECVFVGVFGHQVWLAEANSKWYEIMIMALYVLPGIFSCILYRPLWVCFVPNCYGVLSFIILRLVLGLEAYSVWCWTAIVWIIWAILYVHIANVMVQNKYLSHQSVAYLHLVSFNMVSDVSKKRN